MTLTDPEADEFERTERRLTAWGYACRQNSTALGLPTLSGMSAAIDAVRAETRKRKGVRRTKGEPVKLTANGKQTRSRVEVRLVLNGDVASVDKAVSMLPKWAKKPIFRAYMYGQPDRIACDDLRMRKGEYIQRRRAAVELVAIQLGRRYISR